MCVGDTIAYAVRQANQAVLKIGTVLNIYYRNSERSWERGLRVRVKAVGGKSISTLQNRDRIVLVERTSAAVGQSDG